MDRVPFSPSEVEVKEYIKPYRPWMPEIPVFSPIITPRENFLAFYQGKKPLWMPSFLDEKRFDPRQIPDNRAKGFVSDASPFNLAEEAGGKDWFGIDWHYDPASHGSLVDPYDHKVKNITHWENYVTLPDLESIDWEGCAKANQDYLNDGRLTKMGLYSGLFERLMSFMGMQNAMIALVDEDEQEGVHRLFDYLCGFYDELMGLYKKWFRCDVIWFHDDWGSDRAPLCSYATYEEMIAPYLKRIVDSAHRHGMYFELHSCGKNETLVPLMIQCGVDAWHGQEINDKERLYEAYGDQIKLGISPVGYEIMDPARPPMTEEQTRKAYEDILNTYSQGNVFLGMYMGYHKDSGVILYEMSRQAYNN